MHHHNAEGNRTIIPILQKLAQSYSPLLNVSTFEFHLCIRRCLLWVNSYANEQKCKRLRQQRFAGCIDLARVKSEGLVNIYSLLEQNIKSCNVKQRRQRER